MALRVLVCARELKVEALRGIFVKPGRFLHEIFARGEARQLAEDETLAARESSEHELRKKPIAALLEITAIGHLRDDVGGADHVSDAPEQRVGHADRLSGALVPGVMHERRRRVREVPESKLAHVLAKEHGATRHVRKRVFGAEAMLAVAALS